MNNHTQWLVIRCNARDGKPYRCLTQSFDHVTFNAGCEHGLTFMCHSLDSLQLFLFLCVIAISLTI